MRMAYKRRWQRIVVVTITVAHVAAEQDCGMMQYRVLSLLRFHQTLDESRKHFRVVLLNLHELVLLLGVVSVMRERMKAFGYTEVRVRAHARLTIHRHRNDARDVRLKREGHEVEH